jgi:hypothetical protein
MKKIAILVSMLAIVLAGTLAVSLGSSTASAADDPQAAFQTFIDAVNADDGAAMVASFTPNGYFEDFDPNGTFGIFGTAALQSAFSEGVGTHVVVTDSSVTGNTVSGTLEVSDDQSQAAGVARYVQTVVATADGDKLASFILHYDTSDAQTATLLQYEKDQPDEGDDGEGPSDFVQFDMGGNQAGQAGLGTAGDGAIFAFIGVDAGPEGVEQPAAIRSGTCASLGAVTQWLAPLLSGNDGNLLSMSMDDLTSSPHAFTVSDSAANSNVIVSCANIVKSSGSVGLPNTGTGGSNGAGLSWLIASLALAGVAFAGAGTFAARRR